MVFLALVASLILFWDPVLCWTRVGWWYYVGILIELVVLNIKSRLCTGLKADFWLLNWFPMSYLLAALISLTSWSPALVSDLVRNSLRAIFFVHHSLFSFNRQSFFIDSDPHWWFWARIDQYIWYIGVLGEHIWSVPFWKTFDFLWVQSIRICFFRWFSIISISVAVLTALDIATLVLFFDIINILLRNNRFVVRCWQVDLLLRIILRWD